MVSTSNSETAVRDFWPRVLLSPVIGATIPNLAGLISNERYGGWALVLHYSAFAGIAFAVWEGNRRLYERARSRYAWFKQPLMRVVVLLGAIALFTVPVTAAALAGWGMAVDEPRLTFSSLALAVVLTVTVAIFIVHVYESVFMLRHWQSDRSHNERLERARLQAELDALQREADPHFLYNSLNSLSHLIETNPSRALAFVEALAATYRYVVHTRGRALVPLEEELMAVERQRMLASIRYGHCVRVAAPLSLEECHTWMLPPLTLQELFENAVKHNAVGSACDFEIHMRREGATLLVSNPIRPKPFPVTSTGRGLTNLDERLRLLAGSGASWGQRDDVFEVRVPLVACSVESGEVRRPLLEKRLERFGGFK
ncbi:MAG: sensor histidine kinase [Vicinamibacterales bacterium]